MTNDQNPATRRSSERIDARIQVKFRSGQEFAKAYSQNISRGGIYLETKTLPDPNATVEIALDLELPTKNSSLGEILLKGKVVRLMTINVDGQTVHKIALQFIDVEPQIQAKLDALYIQLGGK